MARTWDQSAPGYDRRWVHGLQTEAEHRVWSGLFRRLLGDQPLRILDVGCGTGVATLLLAGLGHDVVGINLSAGMLAKARENAARAGLDVTLEQGPAEATPFADGQFDAVVSRQVLWSLAEPERAVREWVRVVRPGGRVIAVDGFWHDPRPLARASVRAGDALARLYSAPACPGTSGCATSTGATWSKGAFPIPDNSLRRVVRQRAARGWPR